jgi:integrase
LTWYQKVRLFTTKKYVLKAKAKGIRLVNHNKPLTTEDLEYICSYLYGKNDLRSFMNRAVFTLMWQCLGRISEILNLNYADLSWHKTTRFTCLQIILDRLKTYCESDLNIVIHAFSYLRCPINALATWLVLRVSCDDYRIFEGY